MITKLEFEKCWGCAAFSRGCDDIFRGVLAHVRGVAHPKTSLVNPPLCTLYTVHIHSKADVTKIFDF